MSSIHTRSCCRRIRDRDGDQRETRGPRSVFHVVAAPKKVGEERLRAGVSLLAEHREPVLGLRSSTVDALAVQLKLGELELGVLVAENARRCAGIPRRAPSPD